MIAELLELDYTGRSEVNKMVRVRYLKGFCRVYGKAFYPNMWTEVPDDWLPRLSNDSDWEIETEETVEETTELVEESLEETVEETLVVEEETSDEAQEEPSLSMTKKELQALCDEKGLEYSKLDTKSTLLGLLSGEEE